MVKRPNLLRIIHTVILLLCSDGLTNMVDDEKLEEILSEDCTEEEYAGKCIEEALFYGGLDNIAVVIARNRSGR